MLNKHSLISFFKIENKFSLGLLVIIIFVHVFILTKLIYFPYPELFIYPYLTNHGLKPYSQILDQHFPGLMFLPINFDNLGMNTPEQARIWSICLAILIHLMMFLISNAIFKDKSKALLVNLFYLVWQPFFEGWVLWIDSFLPLILLPAFYFLYRRWLFVTGLLLGIGIIFKQVLMPLSLLVLVYLVWEQKKFKAVLLYFSGLVLPVLLMLIYLSKIGVIWDFWYWTIIFNLTVYAKYGKKIVPSLAHLTRVGFVFGSSIGLLLLKKNLLSKDNRLGHLLFIFLVGSLAGVFARFDFVHFQPALPFAILGIIYSLSWLRNIKLFWVLAGGFLTITLWWQVIFYKGHLGDKIYFFDAQTYELANKVKQYVKPQEKIFVLGSVPHLYQMTNTLPAGGVYVFQFPWFLMVAEERLLSGLLRDQPQIVVLDRTVEIEGQSITTFARRLDQYIQQNYKQIDRVDNTEILRRI